MRRIRHILLTFALLISVSGFGQNNVLTSGGNAVSVGGDLLYTVTDTGVAFTSTYSILLDGVDERIDIDNVLTSSLATTTVGTISFWTKPVDATPIATEVMVSFGDTDANTVLAIQNQSDGDLLTQIISAGTSQWQLRTNVAPFSSGVWAHVIVVQGGTEAVQYINGVLRESTITADADRTQWFNNILGLDNGTVGDRNYNSSGHGNHYNGNIDEIHFFNINLSASEITELYNGGVGWDVRNHSKAANLVSGFHIDGDVINTCTDYVGSNNGTYVNVEQSDIELDVP